MKLQNKWFIGAMLGAAVLFGFPLHVWTKLNSETLFLDKARRKCYY